MKNYFVAAVVCGSLLNLMACAPKSAAGQFDGPQSAQEIEPTPDSLPKSLLSEVVRQGVPSALAKLAFKKFATFADQVKNSANLAIVDFRLKSDVPRFYLIDTSTGHVDKLLVAHGSGSDPSKTGIPTKFSNLPNSEMSSLGAYIVNELFQSAEHGTAARLDGLEATNNLARDRGIILHSATYVAPGMDPLGMSWGCPAVSLDWIARALDRLSGGGFLYIFGEGTSQTLDDRQLLTLMTDPAYQWVNESEDAPAGGEF